MSGDTIRFAHCRCRWWTCRPTSVTCSDASPPSAVRWRSPASTTSPKRPAGRRRGQLVGRRSQMARARRTRHGGARPACGRDEPRSGPLHGRTTGAGRLGVVHAARRRGLARRHLRTPGTTASPPILPSRSASSAAARGVAPTRWSPCSPDRLAGPFALRAAAPPWASTPPMPTSAVASTCSTFHGLGLAPTPRPAGTSRTVASGRRRPARVGAHGRARP